MWGACRECQSSLSPLSLVKPIVENFHQFEGIRWVTPGKVSGLLDNWSIEGNLSSQKEMENCPSLYLMDNVERKGPDMC